MFFSPRCFCLVLECLADGISHLIFLGLELDELLMKVTLEIPRYGVLTDPESTKQLQPRLGHFDWHSGLMDQMDQIQLQLGLLEHWNTVQIQLSYDIHWCRMLSIHSSIILVMKRSRIHLLPGGDGVCQQRQPSDPKPCFFLSPTRALQSDGIWVSKDSDCTQGLFYPKNKCGCSRTTGGCFRVCHLGI